jgi:hypothetical protein
MLEVHLYAVVSCWRPLERCRPHRGRSAVAQQPPLSPADQSAVAIVVMHILTATAVPAEERFASKTRGTARESHDAIGRARVAIETAPIETI